MGFTPHKNVKIWGFQKVVTSSKKNHKIVKSKKTIKLHLTVTKIQKSGVSQKSLPPVKKILKNHVKTKKTITFTVNCNINIKIWGLQKVVSPVQKNLPHFFWPKDHFQWQLPPLGQTFFLVIIDGVGNLSCYKWGKIWLRPTGIWVTGG